MTFTMRLSVGVVAALLMAVQPQARADDPTGQFDHAGLARQIIENHIRPGVERFSADATKLREAVDALCISKTKPALQLATKSFATAVLSYARIEHLRFGPLHEANRQERLLFYPDPKDMVRQNVSEAIRSKDPGVQSLDTLQGKNVSLQGFQALELLLFGDGRTRLLGDNPEARYRCDYARAISADIGSIAALVEREWNAKDGYSKLMMEPGAENPIFFEPKDVTDKIAQSFFNALEEIRDQRVAAPLGLIAPGKPPSSGILELSGLTVPMVAAGTEGLLAFYVEGGLEQRLASFDIPTAAAVRTDLETALATARSVHVSIGVARTNRDEKLKLAAIGFPLRDAHLRGAALLAKAANLALELNAIDGD